MARLDHDAATTGGLAAVYAISALTFAYNIALAAVIMLVPLYLRSQGASAAVLGLATSIPPLVGVVLRLPSGVLSDRIGEKAVLVGANLSMATAAALLVLAPGAPAAANAMIVGALLLSGLSRAVFWPCAQSYASRVAQGDVKRALGVFTSIGNFGQIIGTPICGWLLAAWGFGAGFGLILGGATLAVIVSTRLVARGARPHGQPAQAGQSGLAAALLGMTRSRPLLFGGLCMSGAAIATALAGSFYPVYLADLGLKADAIGWLSSCRALAATGSSLALGVIGSRLSTPAAWLAGAGIAGLGILFTPMLSSFAGLAIAIAMVGASSGVMQVVAIDVAARFSEPGNRAKAMAFTGLFYSVALWIIPLGLGLIAQAMGIRNGFLLLGGFWLAVAVAVVAPARRMFSQSGGRR